MPFCISFFYMFSGKTDPEKGHMFVFKKVPRDKSRRPLGGMHGDCLTSICRSWMKFGNHPDTLHRGWRRIASARAHSAGPLQHVLLKACFLKYFSPPSQEVAEGGSGDIVSDGMFLMSVAVVIRFAVVLGCCFRRYVCR